MLVTTSQHNESIRTRASDVWQRHHGANFRPILNLQALANLIQIAAKHGAQNVTLESTSDGNDKKRSISPTPPERSSKRRKASNGASVTATGNSSSSAASHDDHSEFTWSKAKYPLLISSISRKTEVVKNTEDVRVFQHVFDMHYNSRSSELSRDADDEQAEENDLWQSEERDLHTLLRGLFPSMTGPISVDLGTVTLVEHHGRLIGISEVLSSRFGTEDWLLILPRLTHDMDLDALDHSSRLVEDLIMACHILQTMQRITIDTHLRLTVLPPSAYDTEQCELPFRLELDFNVSLLIPTIFEPLPRKETKKKVLEAEDAQRRLLSFLYPSLHNSPPSFSGVSNIPYFYSILGPAPALPSTVNADALQPKDLRPTLLPFQRRSLAWLLQREGKTFNSDGDLVSSESPNFSFWETVEEGNYTWFYDRLSGAIAATQPSWTPALGGILAEEPGLGKTLEMISLIIMNPAPPAWNPTLTRWDPEARMDIKAIKVSTLCSICYLSTTALINLFSRHSS